MQDLLFLLLPLTLVLVVGGRLQHASPSKATYARLAAVKSELVRRLSTAWRPDVYVTDHLAAHRLLVRGSAGGAFSNRSPFVGPSAVLSCHCYYNLNSAPYGPLWRTIRRNLTSEVFHPSRLRHYAPAHRRALRGLVADLDEQRVSNGVVLVAESMRAAMCFGDDVNADRVAPWPTPRTTSSSALSGCASWLHSRR